MLVVGVNVGIGIGIGIGIGVGVGVGVGVVVLTLNKQTNKNIPQSESLLHCSSLATKPLHQKISILD